MLIKDYIESNGDSMRCTLISNQIEGLDFKYSCPSFDFKHLYGLLL